jgi:Fe2+ transport system protein B
MEKKMRLYLVIACAAWVLIMASMSFSELKYGVRYYLFNSQVEAEFQASLAEYKQAMHQGEEDVRNTLQAAKRYDRLQYLSLATKRNSRLWSTDKSAQQETQGEETTAYASPQAEMAALEAGYSKSTLKKYRAQDAQTESRLLDEVHARLHQPKKRESRLAAVLFHLFALPFIAALALLVYERHHR